MKFKWPGGILIFFSFLIPIAVSPYTFDQYGIPKLAFFIILCGILLGEVLRHRTQLSRLPKSVGIMLGFFLLVQFWQTIRLPAPLGAFFGEYGQSESFLAQAGFILIFLAGFLFLNNEPILSLLRRVSIFTVFAVCIYGLYEYFWNDPFTHSAVTRVKSLIGDPNSLGIFLILILPLLYWELTTTSSRIYQFLSAAAIFLGSTDLLLTFSRSAWLGFICCTLIFIVIAFLQHKNRRRLILFLFILIICGAISGEALTRFQFRSHQDYDLPARINSVAQGNDSGRGLIWPIAWQVFKTSPFSGYGIGTFQDLFHRYESKKALDHWGPERDLREAHNETLHYLATQGLLGLFAYLGLLSVFCWAIRPRKAWELPSMGFTVLGSALIGYLIFVQFAYPLIHYSFIFWLYWGILLNQRIPDNSPLVSDRKQNSPTVIRIVVLGIFLGGAVWLGYRVYQADVYYQKAFNLGHYSHYQRSLLYFPKMIALNPWMYQYRYRHALTYVRAARHADKNYRSLLSRHYLRKAQAILQELALSYPDRYQIPFFRGRIEEYLRNNKKAGFYYRQAARRFPTNYKLWFRLAVAEKQSGQQQAAHIAWQTGLKIDPAYMRERLRIEKIPSGFFQ